MIQGLDKLLSQLGSLAEINKAEATKEAAQIVLDEAQVLVPVDTGELRDSGHLEEQEGSIEVVFGTDHAIPIEFGTSRMEAQPFLRPAMENKRKEVLDATAEEVQEQIRSLIR